MKRLNLSILAGVMFCILIAPGKLFAQDEPAAGRQDRKPSDAAAAQSEKFIIALPNLRLTGEQVNVNSLQKLAGYAWGSVTLAGAHFDGAIFESLRQAESIQTLGLSGDGMSGQIPRLRQVKGLKGLELYGPLLGRDLRAIGNLTQLEHLSLPKDLTINVTGARAIAQLVQLKSLKLYHVDIDDASFKELHTLTQLEKLDLMHSSISDDGLKTLSAMPHLKQLELLRYDHEPNQLTDASMPVIAKLTELESLSLRGKISKAGLAQIARLPKLKWLNLSATNLSLSSLEVLEHSSVERLTLSSDLFRGPVGNLDYLRKIPNLKNLSIIGQPSPIEDQLPKLLPGVGLDFDSG